MFTGQEEEAVVQSLWGVQSEGAAASSSSSAAADLSTLSAQQLMRKLEFGFMATKKEFETVVAVEQALRPKVGSSSQVPFAVGVFGSGRSGAGVQTLLVGEAFVGAVGAAAPPRRWPYGTPMWDKVLAGTQLQPALSNALIAACDGAVGKTPAAAAPAHITVDGEVGAGGSGMAALFPSAAVREESALVQLQKELARERAVNSDLRREIEELSRPATEEEDDDAFASPVIVSAGGARRSSGGGAAA